MQRVATLRHFAVAVVAVLGSHNGLDSVVAGTFFSSVYYFIL